jgi:hypothetical protein
MYSQGSGEFSSFRKVTGPDEVGEPIEDGIEILKVMAASLSSLNGKMDLMLNMQGQTLRKQDQMLDLQKHTVNLHKEDIIVEEIRGLRSDLKSYRHFFRPFTESLAHCRKIGKQSGKGKVD